MYKSIKITKRISISFEKFRKTRRELSIVYNNGFHKWKDDINGLNFYGITVSNFRLVLNETKKCICGTKNI